MKDLIKLMVSSKSAKLNVPNIRHMELAPKIGTDPFLDLFVGIKKVLRPGSPEFTKLADSKIEKYLRYQQKRLFLLSVNKEYDKFWKLANHLIRSSKAFRMLALRNVRPNWYREAR